MAYIKTLKDNELIGGQDTTDVYPITSTQAVYSQKKNGSAPEGKKALLEERLTDIESQIEELIDTPIGTDGIADGAVITRKIADNAITTSKIDTGAITSEKIVSNAVTNDKIANNTITGDKFTDDSIDGSKIKDNSVPGSKLADGAVGSVELQDNTLSGSKLMDGTISGAKLIDSAVSGIKIMDNSIDGSKIADSTIQSLDIKDNSIPGSKLADGTITTAKLQDGIIGNDKIANGTLTGSKFIDGSISGEKIQSNTIHGSKLMEDTVDGVDIIANSINGSKLKENSVDGSKLTSGAVDTMHLKPNSITNDKIVDNAVSTDKIRSNTITGAKFADNSITSDKLIGTFSGQKIADNTLTGSKIVDNTISGSKIIDNTVSGSKLQDGTIQGVDIQDNTLNGAKLINNSIDGAKIADGAIESKHLLDNSIPGEKIKDGTIENVDIKDGTLDGSKIKDNTVQSSKIADGAITTAKIVNETVTGSKIASGAVTEDKLADGAVTSDKIADDAITELQTIMDEVPVEDSVKPVMSGGVYSFVPAMAGDLESWAATTQSVEYIQDNIVDTTGGSISINSSVPASLVSLAAKTDFKATALIATGFNLLRYATAIGAGWYFPVPALKFGIINMANEPNGILFTNSEGVNLTPTVYFKPLSDGVPTSVTDGTACTYVDAISNEKNYRFYTTNEPGYMIISGIDRTATCAHIGWSKRYDEYISITNANDTGATVDVAAGIHALHSYDLMLNVGGVADKIEKTGTNQVTWHRLVDRVQPAWTTTPNEVSEGSEQTYTHAATISTMKSNGAAAFMNDNTLLTVSGTTISYVDTSDTGSTDYVKYELATIATGTASISSSFAVEDWGLIFFQDAEGKAYITLSYAQNIQDSLRAMLTNIDNKTVPVLSEAIAMLYNELKVLRNIVLKASYKVINAEKYTIMGNDTLLLGTDVPDITPKSEGQWYIDTTNKKVYVSYRVTKATSDWILLN